jgi:ABC-type branched-subunit amino acid transport system ATPase component
MLKGGGQVVRPDGDGLKMSGLANSARLEANNLEMRFGGIVALSDVSIQVMPGQIVGVIGPNGAGKTTLFALLCGLLKPTQGSIFLDGIDITRKSPQFRARRGLARTFQRPEVFASLTARQHIQLAYRSKHMPRRLWTDLIPGLSKGADMSEESRVRELCEELGISDAIDQRVGTLPLGTTRRVEVARALACDPSVLLLDEPTSGMDSAESSRLTQVLSKVHRDSEMAILIIEHDVEIVTGISDLIYVLDFGQVIATDTPARIRENKEVQAAYIGKTIT